MTKTKSTPLTPAEFCKVADSFTKGYLTTALWAESASLGVCDNPDCGADNPDQVPVEDDRCTVCGSTVWGTDRSFEYLDMDVMNCSPELLGQMVADCAAFQAEMDEYITLENLERLSQDPYASYGHDFWLTRNRHGAGFWDGDYLEPAATKLAFCAEHFGTVNLYVGDDGLVYA